jgi:hypothetical protein
MQYGNPHERALDKYRSRGSARSAEDLEVISSELGSMVDLADESASLAATYDAQRQLVGSQSDERENLNNRMEFLGNWIEDSAKHQVRHDAEIGSRTDEITVEVNRLHAQVQSLGKMAEEIKEVI